MTPDDLDRILAADELVQPSSTFSRNVMAAIHRDAADAPRLSFPWLRFGVGVTAGGVMAGSATVLATQAHLPAVSMPPALAPLSSVAPEMACAVAAILIGLGMAAVPRVLCR
jgi:uncharacterized membrane protein YoaK (UPF0700 family)